MWACLRSEIRPVSVLINNALDDSQNVREVQASNVTTAPCL